MTAVVSNFPVNLASGVQALGPSALPDGMSSLTVRMARCTTVSPTIWPNVTTTIAVALFVSVDGGLSWIAAGAFTAGGGIYIRGGVELVETNLTVSPIPAGSSRQVKGTITVADGPLVSSVSIDAN